MRVGNAALITFLGALNMVFGIIEWSVLVWVIISWALYFVSQSSLRWQHKQAYSILRQLNDLFTRVTYPILWPFRKILPAHKTAGIDWSPVLLLLAIWVVRTFLTTLLTPLVLR